MQYNEFLELLFLSLQIRGLWPGSGGFQDFWRKGAVFKPWFLWMGSLFQLEEISVEKLKRKVIDERLNRGSFCEWSSVELKGGEG